MAAMPTILIIDDEVRSLESMERILRGDFDVKTASNIADANAILAEHWLQVVVCDQRMPDQTGVEFLKSVRERWPDIIRMIVSGYTDANDIIDGINDAGIFQYITKPWHPENLILTLKNACRLYDLQRENELLAVELKMSPSAAGKKLSERRDQLRKDYDFDDGIVRGPDSPMNAVCATLRQIAPYDVSVLLSGASGTGKELAARVLHYGSLRWNKPFVVENCGALPDELLESELFGHKRGAFTGAIEDHVGIFERANGGTVFLDEIGEVSPAFQVKLLRVLQEGEIRPVGAANTRKVDVRVIAATNRDLEEEVRMERFRADLYYRLAGIVVRLPDLKDRRNDIPVLARTLLTRAMSALGKRVEGLSEEAIECLTNYPWPGNVRELQNEIQQMLVLGQEDSVLGAELLSGHILRSDPAGGDVDDIDDIAAMEGTLRDRIGALESRIIRETLIRNRWNKSKAAAELGLSRVGLRAKLERYGLGKVKPLPTRKVAGSNK
ncbi:sigma-54-dependent transcriptional regulator [Hoeflea sp. TYP-13]|uniref:sigma-54-dependent transcriptional regulator n=1 Tax=Hoeflea sp. TYP-13 TaxID=3230023 RepID=UPI0034C5C1F2